MFHDQWRPDYWAHIHPCIQTYVVYFPPSGNRCPFRSAWLISYQRVFERISGCSLSAVGKILTHVVLIIAFDSVGVAFIFAGVVSPERQKKQSTLDRNWRRKRIDIYQQSRTSNIHTGRSAPPDFVRYYSPAYRYLLQSNRSSLVGTCLLIYNINLAFPMLVDSQRLDKAFFAWSISTVFDDLRWLLTLNWRTVDIEHQMKSVSTDDILDKVS